MKTKKQVLQEFPDYKVLINAVISRVGMDSIEDINNHGIDGEFQGFIYYADTHKFSMTYRKKIVELLEEEASQLGEDAVAMVGNFVVFRGSPMDRKDKKDLYAYLGGGKVQQGTITNVMAWFAAEEVCRFFDE